MPFTRNPDKLEAKALQYEAKGKTAKAIKCREKAARIRYSHGGVPTATVSGVDLNRDGIPDKLQGGLVGGVGIPTSTSTVRTTTTIAPVSTMPYRTAPRTIDVYEANALKWEQRGNWHKAQKNREKAWRMRNTQYSNVSQYGAPQFYQNNRFLGYDLAPVATVTGTDFNRDGIPDQLQGGVVGHGVPLGGHAGLLGTGVPVVGHGVPVVGHGVPVVGHGVPLAGHGGFTDYNRDGIPDQLQGGGVRPGFGLKKRDPIAIEARAAEYERRGKPQKAARLRAKALAVRNNTYVSQRQPSYWEQNALKWEQRGNWDKAQRNRAKYWRYQNPQYAGYTAPNFYQNNSFLGYNVPFNAATAVPLPGYTPGAYTTGYGVPQQHGGLSGLLGSRDPVKLELRAQEAERRGKVAKAAKLRAKAAGIKGNSYKPYRSPAAIEAKALHFEQQGNYKKAQKLREKAWRLSNPQYINYSGVVPSFYNNNAFIGYQAYNTQYASQFTTTAFSNLSIAQHTQYRAPIVETVVRPTIVNETLRHERIVEVQPIIHRDIEAPTVKVIEKHIYETVPSAGPHTITNTAIVQETVIPKIIEEIQPVIHRDVPAPFIERVEQHVSEHIVQPTIHTKEVITDSTVRTAAVGVVGVGAVGVTGVPIATVTGTDLNRDGIPDQLQGGARVGVGMHVGVPTATVTGTDMNRDGIPDALQGGVRVGAGMHVGVPTATVTGTDMNRDGIPDALQGGVRRI